MAYSELIKNFETVRAYMRDFYVYGFKSRSEYDRKSARSYDDERRRIESWLGEYMRFTQTAEGKNVFLTVDNRTVRHDPFYKAWKAKSFTDKDITLHFILFDILPSPEVRRTLTEIIDVIDADYLSSFPEPMSFDESTVRKKLREYVSEGIIETEKLGRKVWYRRAADISLSGMTDALDFFAETAPCGAVGSFINDKLEAHDSPFSFKHRYITQTLDSGILASVFDAMGQKKYIFVTNLGRHTSTEKRLKLVPLRIYASVQSGRQNLIAVNTASGSLYSYRLDYLTDVETGEECADFDSLRERFGKVEKYMWGVNARWNANAVERVEFTVRVGREEGFIVRRLEREKRCGTVKKLNDEHWRFSAEVFDSLEMLPWIRTFISRITCIHFSNPVAQKRFSQDMEEMYAMYGVDGGEEK